MEGEQAVIPHDIWQRVRAKLKFQHGEAAFNSWLKMLELQSVSQGLVVLSAPTRFIREWVLAHYIHDIIEAWREEDTSIHSVDIALAEGASTRPTSMPSDMALAPKETKTTTKEADAYSAAVEETENLLDPRFTFDNFVVGASNELAHAAARGIAEADSVMPGSNPLFLYGGVGLGKTHLMHAIAWHIKTQQQNRKVVYLSAEKFMYQFIQALRNKDIMAFKEYFRSVDVLMIDDVQFICGKDSTQEEFFHTFNALIDNNRQLIISADRSPTDLDGMEERIRSRLGWGLVADINTTTFELRLGILQSKTDQLGINVPEEVLEFLARKITSNVRELEGALNKVVAHSSLIKRDITLESTQSILSDLLRSHDRIITIEEIQRRVSEHCNIRMADMHSSRRARQVARPRQMAMYLAKKLTTCSLPEIGRKFGGKDHTTVMHAVKRMEELSAADRQIAEDIKLLTRVLQS